MVRPERRATVDRTLAGVADPVRRQIVELLALGPARAGELASRLSVPFPSMSRHLRTLRRAAVVVDDRVDDDARGRRYRLDPGALDSLRHWLRGLEAGWAGQLTGFKQYAERAVAPRGRNVR